MTTTTTPHGVIVMETEDTPVVKDLGVDTAVAIKPGVVGPHVERPGRWDDQPP